MERFSRVGHRLAGVLVGALAVWLADSFGVELTDEHVGALQGGLTVLGLVVFQAGYALTHRLLKPAPREAAMLGGKPKR